LLWPVARVDWLPSSGEGSWLPFRGSLGGVGQSLLALLGKNRGYLCRSASLFSAWVPPWGC